MLILTSLSGRIVHISTMSATSSTSTSPWMSFAWINLGNWQSYQSFYCQTLRFNYTPLRKIALSSIFVLMKWIYVACVEFKSPSLGWNGDFVNSMLKSVDSSSCWCKFEYFRYTIYVQQIEKLYKHTSLWNSRSQYSLLCICVFLSDAESKVG